MKELFSLKDKIAVITGGLRQLGQQFSIALAEYGAQIAVLDLVNEKEVNKNERFSYFQQKDQIKCFKVDITNRKEVENILSEIKAKFGSPNILVNNAALDSPPDSPASENGPFEDYPEASLDKILNVNIKGTFICCQVFGGEMAEKKGGSIINISSIYGILSPNQDIYEFKRKNGEKWFKPVAYAVSKSGVLNLTRYLATYWSKKGVRVNTLTPAGIFNDQGEEFLSEYLKRMPIGRMANENEMNGAVIFLASEASSYMTGSNLVVDGGWSAW
ncbi:MAG: short-chain dehydrogenase [Candidatus Muiribacterium halophilum]|uniref:Short-chain dehydrogenase n=1 Tax=Muiribacterium halophilum TaxID=2053465 RepID=A0A2N5ZA26_MUIH1|nr:MAG: short-chain dehydrogenase [Candidatus Muirbacterium halophilum]